MAIYELLWKYSVCAGIQHPMYKQLPGRRVNRIYGYPDPFIHP